ncbi:hypothetical protein PS9374_06786 [Planomonospora sphaerica]|uniref:Uncharacterized protein n=1 Tax=Planomonospora sphaerica TaxID=161355 RepID=A0A171DPW4_9ACTN|nr:hypothetical protein PS9374_06786 [Planomonospora sphaerica]
MPHSTFWLVPSICAASFSSAAMRSLSDFCRLWVISRPVAHASLAGPPLMFSMAAVRLSTVSWASSAITLSSSTKNWSQAGSSLSNCARSAGVRYSTRVFSRVSYRDFLAWSSPSRFIESAAVAALPPMAVPASAATRPCQPVRSATW